MKNDQDNLIPISEDNALAYLAELLVEAFLDHKKYYANTDYKQSGDLLPGVDQRTSRRRKQFRYTGKNLS